MEVVNVRTGQQLLAGSIKSPIDELATEPAKSPEFGEIEELLFDD